MSFLAPVSKACPARSSPGTGVFFLPVKSQKYYSDRKIPENYEHYR